MIDFLRYRYVCLAVSVAFLLAGVFAYFVKGGFKYHIDFAGGTELRVLFQQKISTAELRAILTKKGWRDAVIQSVGATEQEFLVRIGEVSKSIENRFLDDMKEALPSNPVKVQNIEWVGAEVGQDTQWNAIKSIVLSLLLLLLYIALRSRYRFAVGAVAALAHDVLAVLVYILLFNEPISLNVLGAILAILGYSLNDTIIIFSRIRENMKKMKGVAEAEIVNISINQTLRRTILTSCSTFFAVLAILLIGGEALRGFSLVMLIGIVFGTYSSIYIASPVMLAVGSSEQK